jgi:hypothetical protein
MGRGRPRLEPSHEFPSTNCRPALSKGIRADVGTLRSAANLASSLSNLGKYVDAEQIEREVLAVRKRVLGAEAAASATPKYVSERSLASVPSAVQNSSHGWRTFLIAWTPYVSSTFIELSITVPINRTSALIIRNNHLDRALNNGTDKPNKRTDHPE